MMPAFELRHRQIGVEAIERAVRPFLHRVHRAGDEAAALVDLAVVQAVVRLVRLGIVDQRHLAGLEIEEVEAARQRHDGAARLAQAHRADLLRHVPGAHLPPVRRAAEHSAVEAVDPVEPLLLDIPERAFAQRGLHVHQNVDAHVTSLSFAHGRQAFRSRSASTAPSTTRPKMMSRTALGSVVPASSVDSAVSSSTPPSMPR